MKNVFHENVPQDSFGRPVIHLLDCSSEWSRAAHRAQDQCQALVPVRLVIRSRSRTCTCFPAGNPYT